MVRKPPTLLQSTPQRRSAGVDMGKIHHICLYPNVRLAPPFLTPREDPMKNVRVNDLYTPHVLTARERVESDARLRSLLDPSEDPVVFERFLSVFSARGVFMTEPVE